MTKKTCSDPDFRPADHAADGLPKPPENGEQASHGSESVRLPPPKLNGAEELAERFENRRLDNLKLGWGVLGGGVHSRLSWLDEAAPGDLSDAADDILRAHSARMLIRAAARLENGWRDTMACGNYHNLASAPASERFLALLQERNQAALFYLETRERLARIEHIESINERARTIKMPKARLPRLRVKTQTA